MAKVAKQTEESPRDAKDFVVPVIKPSSFMWQDEGFAYKTAFVRLPEHMIAQDLHDHPDRIWNKIQSDQLGKALSRFDKVVCVAFDESWMLERWTRWFRRKGAPHVVIDVPQMGQVIYKHQHSGGQFISGGIHPGFCCGASS